MRRHRVLAGAVLISLLAAPTAALAQDGFTATVVVSSTCGLASFEASAVGGAGPYSLTWEFGDGEGQSDSGVVGLPTVVDHDYGTAGAFAWSVTITDSSDPAQTATVGGTLSLGPQVSLTSSPFPPLLTLTEGQATIDFSASAVGGEPPYSFAWDPDGDGVFEPGPDTISHVYDSEGKFETSVEATDGCGLTGRASLAVVVVDPEAEACHPMAQRIADGVNSLFPAQSGQLYTCEDIFGIKGGDLTGQVLGYGRLWHAYQLALTMEDLTWEEILQWKLDGSGWGLLTQLDRFSETLGDVGLRQLFDLVVAGEASVGEIRTAVGAVSRYGADFYDALERVQAGANPGELGQLYRTAADLHLNPAEIDAYLAEGTSLPELRHAGRMVEQSGGDLDAFLAAHADGHSWGEIKQAMNLAGEDGDLAAILDSGVRETRQQEREDERQQRQEEREQAHEDRAAEQSARLADRLARRYGITAEQVLALADGACAGDWECVQVTLKELYPPGRGGGRGGKK